jgi:di/tricarboxylate transporter
MNTDQIAILSIIIFTFILFIKSNLRYDVVSLIALFTLYFLDILLGNENSNLVMEPGKIFNGFGHPAVITVALVLIISHAMKNSGIIDILSRQIRPFIKNKEMHIASLSGTIAILSGFINNVGALALMLPVTLKTAWEQKRSPGLLLMPVAFCSILGGMITMIGTPPNIIIAMIRKEQQKSIIAQAKTNESLQPYVNKYFGDDNFIPSTFSLFDFSPVGGIIALIGVLFVAIIGWRLIPKSIQKKPQTQSLFSMDEYVTEISIPKNSKLIGLSIDKANIITGDKLTIFRKIIHNKAKSVSFNTIINESDSFLVMADSAELKSIMDEYKFDLSTELNERLEILKTDSSRFTEVVITPDSPLVGRSRAYLRKRSSNQLTLLAVARQDKPIHKRLGNVKFMIGDVLLIQSDESNLTNVISNLNLLPLAKRDITIGSKSKATYASLTFLFAITLSLFNIFPTTISFILAILIYIFLGLLPVRDLYKNIDWPIIVLLGAMIPISEALQNTETTTLIANQVVYLTDGFPAWFVLALIMIITMCLSDIINNAATALIMGPISVGIALSIGVSIDPFLMSVAVGASCAFLTPIGHQCNALILGPGGYRFGDYWRLGLPLEILIVLIGTPLILHFWPL